MAKIINLVSRGCNNFLKEVEQKKYQIISEFDIFRIITNPENNDEIVAIDPSGGPMISIGDVISNNVVSKIYFSSKYNGYIIEFNI